MSYLMPDIKGQILTLDPKSKIFASFMMIIGVSLSLEPFSVFLFAIYSVVLLVLYRPRLSFLKKVLLAMPFSIILTSIIYISLESDIIIHFLYFERKYTPEQFAGLVIFRFAVSVIHTAILIESEPYNINIIEGLASFKISSTIITILLLVNRLSMRIQKDYNNMYTSARTRGVYHQNRFRQLMFKMYIFSRILTKAVIYSDSIGESLSVRGFEGEFSKSIREITSEGLAVGIMAILFSGFTILIPLMR